MAEEQKQVKVTIVINLAVADTLRKVSAAYDKEVLAAKKMLLSYVKDQVK